MKKGWRKRSWGGEGGGQVRRGGVRKRGWWMRGMSETNGTHMVLIDTVCAAYIASTVQSMTSILHSTQPLNWLRDIRSLVLDGMLVVGDCG